MFKLSYGLLHHSRVCNRSMISSLYSKLNEFSTTSTLQLNKLKSNLNVNNENQKESTVNIEKSPSEDVRPKSRIVAAAFASLNETVEETTPISTPATDQKISEAKTVDELLVLSNGEGVSRRLALKIVSIIAEWTAEKKIKITDFENDFRFIKLCKVLTKGNKKLDRYTPSKSEDLSTVLSVTADDEAARLVETITVPQMVKVMVTLSSKKRRSTLLLRTLAYNISRSPEKLNLKLCSDILYSMATLNFIDENLLSRVMLDICNELEVVTKIESSAVFGSIFTSLRFLKYKNPVVLDELTEWIMKNPDKCRSQDIFSIFITFATLNYVPENVKKFMQLFEPILNELEAEKPFNWLEFIWAKVLLNLATQNEVSYILSENFLELLAKYSSEQNISTKLKILNVNAAAESLFENYSGNKLAQNSPFRNVSAIRRKEKVEITESIIYALKNLIQAEKYIKTNIDTGCGFCMDAECVLDDKCRPKELNTEPPEGTRIAIISLDYHDMTRGRIEPTGVNAFAQRILEKKGYKVLIIPFNEYNARDKIISRVQYLEKSLKQLVKSI